MTTKNYAINKYGMTHASTTHWNIVKIHYKTGENFAETVCKVKSFLGRREAPSRPAIVKLVPKFELLGQVSDVKKGLL